MAIASDLLLDTGILRNAWVVGGSTWAIDRLELPKTNRFTVKKMGDQAELAFEAMCQRRGWPCRRATKREDRQEHWDFLVQRQRPLRVEVKAAKRLKRSDRDPSLEFTWLEWIGVPKPDGSENPGWLRGSADWIAFQMGKSFLMVKRSEAEKLMDKLAPTAKRCKDFDQPPVHQLYERWTNGELRGIVLLVRLSELKALDQSFLIN